ncbi:MAG: hypothetical protein IKC73_07920 [Clostridia bacterium]|nr:hypothetical protein [Clostridia bacterium]
MKKSRCVRALSLALALVTVVGTLLLVPVGAVTASAATTSADEIAGLLNAEAYASYYERYCVDEKGVVRTVLANQRGPAGAKMDAFIPVDIFNFTSSTGEKDAEGNPIPMPGLDGTGANAAQYTVNMATTPFAPEQGYLYKLENLDGYSGLFTPDSGTVTWTVDVPQYQLSKDAAGNPKDDRGYLFMIEIEYYPIDVADNVATVERSLSINNSIPFAEARALAFSKNWVYGYDDADGNTQYKYLTNGKDYFFGEKSPFRYNQDAGGNDLRYTTYQDPEWRTYTAQDVDGFHHGAFYFFFEAGKSHTISISGTRENLVIKSIKLVPAQLDTTITYEAYLAKYAGLADNAASGELTRIEVEYPTNVSDTSVYSSNDRSSAINSPNSPSSQLLNTIGAQSYNTVGQWASYTFQVTEDGWYDMTMRFRQNLLDGLFVSRTIKLWSDNGDYGLADGTPTVPFAEAYNARFDYDKSWQVAPLGDGTNEFKFYFKKGVTYTLYLEVSLGELSSIIKTVENSLSEINRAYLEIIKLTGAAPDKYRDYGFTELMPDTIRTLRQEAKNLERVSAKFVELCGSKGSQVATLDQVALLLNKMGHNEDEIAANLSNLKSYIGTLGTWLNTAKQQGLLVDYVNIQAPSAEDPRVNANFFQSAWFEIRSFFSSFFVDYNAMGVTDEEAVEESIDVWLAYGRDQSLIWRNLIDSNFTPQSQIAVNLKLVAAGTLLPSVLSGKGPDVYIGLGAADTINYAIRGAIEPVNERRGYINTYGYDIELTEQHESSYKRTYYVDPTSPKLNGDTVDPSTYYVNDPAHPAKTYVDKDGVTRTKYEVKDSAVVFNYANTIPISLLGKTYGVPETTNFPMMFYRLDVLADLGVDIPVTWDDLLETITVFQSNNMQVGLTYASAMTTFVYQMGGSQWLYEDDSNYYDKSQYDEAYAGAQIGLGEDIALDAFRQCCRLYTDYSFPVTFDASNRFRTGEMPLVITDYCSTYNTLTVFATEIRGLWTFTRLPGMERDDGTINNCSISTLTATIMLYKDDKSKQDAAWEYMRWQAGATAQSDYGNQMVALVGPAAKYATANTQALRNLSWTSTELKSIEEQFENLAAIPNFPGSYIIARYIQFAFLAAVNEGAEPVDQMYNYVTIINKELTRKREEFEMKTLAPGEYPPGYKAPSGN